MRTLQAKIISQQLIMCNRTFWGKSNVLKRGSNPLLRLHITNCYEIIFDCNVLKFLTLLFQTYFYNISKGQQKYEGEPAFLRKLNLMVFRVKNGHFWKITANYKISLNNVLCAYYCVTCYQNCCVTNCNAGIQNIQRGAQNFNGKVLFKGKTFVSFF